MKARSGDGTGVREEMETFIPTTDGRRCTSLLCTIKYQLRTRTLFSLENSRKFEKIRENSRYTRYRENESKHMNPPTSTRHIYIHEHDSACIYTLVSGEYTVYTPGNYIGGPTGIQNQISTACKKQGDAIYYYYCCTLSLIIRRNYLGTDRYLVWLRVHRGLYSSTKYSSSTYH